MRMASKSVGGYVAPRASLHSHQQRELPPGLTPEEAKILRKLKKRAHRLDKGFSLCGIRFGWTFIIAIIPGAGDIADLLLNQALIVNKAKQLEGIPDSLVQRMVMNNAVSTGVGFIPIVGDFAIAAWKANSRNVNMVEKCTCSSGRAVLTIRAYPARTAAWWQRRHGALTHVIWVACVQLQLRGCSPTEVSNERCRDASLAPGRSVAALRPTHAGAPVHLGSPRGPPSLPSSTP